MAAEEDGMFAAVSRRMSPAQTAQAVSAAICAAACVSAYGLAHKGDRLHFGTEAQLALGERYALAWLQLTQQGGTAAASDGAAEPPFAFPGRADACDAVATDKAVID